MDAQLAQIYGTGNNAEDDQVKLAAAELLVKLAEDNNVDLNQFDDTEIAQMINELHKTAEFPPAAEEKKESKETPESKESSSESSESAEKAAEEKVAEADFLGRVMAHSFNQELTEIQKQAGIKDMAGKAVSGAKGLFEKHIAPAAKRGGELITGSRARELKGADEIGKRLAPKSKETKYVSNLLKGEKNKVLATRIGLGAGAAGLGAGAAMGKKKESSALDTLASERAWELAKEAGWVDAEGNLVVPQTEEKVASQVDIEVERRALQMLEAEGLPVQWNE